MKTKKQILKKPKQILKKKTKKKTPTYKKTTDKNYTLTRPKLFMKFI